MKPMRSHIPEERWLDRLVHLGGAAITLLTVVGFYAVIYRPLNLRQAEHVARYEQLVMLTAHAEKIQRQHTALRRELASLIQVADAARGRLPSEAREDAFVSDVRRIAAETQVELNDHRLEPPQRFVTHSQTAIRCDCTASYASICRFLQQVEQLARITKIARLELQSRDNSGVYPFQITFVLYYGVPANDTNERRDGPLGKSV